ncbi:MAG: nucleotidyltransferase family protein, partial [Carnobacterium alterfunditum]
IAPHGIEDLINLTVKPTPFFTANIERMAIYEKRVQKKNWKRHWNRIIIVSRTNGEELQL